MGDGRTVQIEVRPEGVTTVGWQDILTLFSHIDVLALVDILLVTLIFYGILRLFKGTQAIQLVRGLLLIAVVIFIVTNFVHGLIAFRWLVRSSIPAILVALPVIFQPELRRALERLGRTAPLFGRGMHVEAVNELIDTLVSATMRLSAHRFGAIIVLEGMTGLQEYMESGVLIDGLVSERLLLAIFYPNAALHDGAVIIRRNRIAAAACVLPLSPRPLDPQLGTRHRAGLGVTEHGDALAIIVSEETGTISVARYGRLVRRLDDKRLRRVLQNFYAPYQRQRRQAT